VFRDLFGAGSAETAAWEARLAAALAEAGGVTGDAGSPPRIPVPTTIDRAAVAGDLVPLPRSFAADVLAEDLARVVASHAAGLKAGERGRVESEVAAPAREAVFAEYDRLSGPWESVSVVALAAIGPGYRVVKLALARADRTAVLQLRWKRGEHGWQVVAAERVRDEHRP
jgi:hypothetical protein